MEVVEKVVVNLVMVVVRSAMVAKWVDFWEVVQVQGTLVEAMEKVIEEEIVEVEKTNLHMQNPIERHKAVLLLK